MTPVRTRRPALALLLAVLLAIGAAGVAALPAVAHHGWGGYDADRVLTLTGTVQRLAYQNPHAMLNLQADGKVWQVVLAPPGRMTARGLPDGAVRTGQTVTVVGYPSKSDPAELRAERITVGDRKVELR